MGRSRAVFFAHYGEVVVLDTDSARVDKINNKRPTAADDEREIFLAEKHLSLTATPDRQAANRGANFLWRLPPLAKTLIRIDLIWAL